MAAKSIHTHIGLRRLRELSFLFSASMACLACCCSGVGIVDQVWVCTGVWRWCTLSKNVAKARYTTYVFTGRIRGHRSIIPFDAACEHA